MEEGLRAEGRERRKERKNDSKKEGRHKEEGILGTWMWRWKVCIQCVLLAC